MSEARFRRLVESNIIGVNVVDYSGRIIEANDAYLTMVGYTREELIRGQLRWDRMTPPEYRDRDEHAIRELKRSGACTPFEKQLLAKDGRRFPVMLGAALLEGSQDQCVAFILDLTEQKRAEEALAQLLEREQAARREAETANRAKDEFLATVSHELRTPLTAILGWSRLLRTAGLEGEQAARAIETIERNARIQTKLVEDILDVSRIITGKLRLHIRPVNLPGITGAAVDAVRPAADAKIFTWKSLWTQTSDPSPEIRIEYSR